jgi:hypothetical protein
MENFMNVLHVEKKGKMLDTLEKHHIYKETKMDTQINDKLTVQANPIFEKLINNNPHREQ